MVFNYANNKNITNKSNFQIMINKKKYSKKMIEGWGRTSTVCCNIFNPLDTSEIKDKIKSLVKKNFSIF